MDREMYMEVLDAICRAYHECNDISEIANLFAVIHHENHILKEGMIKSFIEEGEKAAIATFCDKEGLSK